jgi:hypothetical protein
MARKSKLRPAQIRQIYRSTETAKALGTRYDISQQMIYLIKGGRVHKRITKGLTRRSKSAPAHTQATIDIDALADAIVNRLIKRLRSS